MSDAAWKEVRAYLDKEWDAAVVPVLSEYIKIPNQSPDFDKDIYTNGLQEKAMAVLMDWVKAQNVPNLTMDLLEEKGKRTPMLYIEVPAAEGCKDVPVVLMYGHMDKQPPLPQSDWAEGLAPYTPVIRDGKLYGRGGADDGYALLASLLSVTALQKAKLPHGRICIIIEGCEESGSFDLEHYIKTKLAERIGADVGLVVALDSGALNYEQLWLTVSLRGVIGGVLKVESIKEGIHSGLGGGLVPDTFRIGRKLLDRIEDPATGNIVMGELSQKIPDDVVKDFETLNTLEDTRSQLPLLSGVKSEEEGTNAARALRNCWMPSLTITGADGLGPCADAGNVVRPFTSFKLSIRLPPHVDAVKATAAVKKLLESDPPHGAHVSFTPEEPGQGWGAPPLAPWLRTALTQGSQERFGNSIGVFGLGGSIPLLGYLGELYPKAQFLVTGVLGPQSNAHGPNEFLHIDFGKGINYCVSRAIAALVKK